MELAATAAPPFLPGFTAVICGLACASMAVFFGGGWIELGFAGAIGLAIAGIEWLQSRLGWEHNLIFPVAGFFAAFA